MSDSVWSGVRKEAYEFAKLLTVVQGVSRVIVKKHSEIDFTVLFDIEQGYENQELYIELVHLIVEYDLQSICSTGEQWGRAFDEVRRNKI
jgi:hypothetical protein